VLLIVLGLVAGCNSESEGVKQAQKLLPLGKPQEALDKLGSDKTPEAHYLRALSLLRMDLRDAAAAELQKALEQKPDESKYVGLQLRLQMQEHASTGGAEEVDRIIQLHEANKTSPALALFAATAYARRGNARAAGDAFRTAVALSESVPELLPEMLSFALRAEMPAEAKSILDKLDKLGPGDKMLAKQKVATLLLLNENEEALRLARSIYSNEHSEDTALLYARAIARSTANDDRDTTMQSLRNKFPGSRDLLTLHCGYLVRSQRLDKALFEIDVVLGRTISKVDKQALALLAVGFPLEMGNADVAEQQIKRYRAEIGDPLVIDFYEARVAHVRRDFDTAATRLAKLIQSTKDDPQSIALAREAAMWLDIVHGDQRLANALKKATEETKTSTPQESKK
jgi:predicted Zn-dependent protease